MDDFYDLEEEKLYEGYSDDSIVKEMQGITDKVTDYTYTNLSYPCIIFKDGVQLERHKVQVISNMIKYGTGSSIVKDIAVYFTNVSQLYKMGMLSGIQLSSFLDIAGKDNITVFLDKDTELKGSMMYALCCM